MLRLRIAAVQLCLAGVLVFGSFPCVAPAVAADAPKVSFTEIEESLTCQCGCGLTVHSCNHLQCGSALPLRDEIREQMALGKDKAQILDHFREKYGEKILSSPTTKGFNLLAWVMPFVLVALGGVIVGITVLRWRRQPARDSGPATAESRPRSAYDQVLESELKNFDG
jgi:cytochrome c-type biogenesis protein CcmH